MDKIVETFASLLNNGSESEFATSLKDAEGNWKSEDEIAQTLKGGVEALISKHQEVGENKYKRGLKEGASKLEKALLAKSGLSIEAQGRELVEQVIDSITTSAKTDLTEETVADHPLVKSLLAREVNTRIDAYKNEVETSYHTELQTLKSKQLRSALDKNVQQILLDGKAKLEDDSGDVSRKLSYFLSSLNVSGFGQNSEGEIVPIDSEGNQLQDPKTLKYISLKDHILSVQPYGVHKFNPNNKAPGVAIKAGKVSEESQKLAKEIRGFGSYTEFTAHLNTLAPKQRYAYRKAARELQVFSS